MKELKFLTRPDFESMTEEQLIAFIEHAKGNAAYLDVKEKSLKVLCNGIYGALGNQYFRFFLIALAEAITLSGQMVIETSRDFFNDYLNGILKPEEDRDYVVILDTDSVYIDFTPLIERVGAGKSDEEIVKFLDKLGATKCQELIQKNYDLIFENTNSFSPRLEMKRESIGQAIVVQKKRYVMRVFDNEGVRYAVPEIKIMGLEPVRSNVPQWCRKRLEKAFTMVFDCTEEEIQNEILSAREEFFKLPVEQIAEPISITDLGKYLLPTGFCKPGATRQAKASAAFNRHIRRLKIEDKYPPINSGDKIKILTLLEPNLLMEDVIGFTDKLPKEFEIEDFVDRQAHFEKNYYVPLERFIAVVGWTPEKKYDLGAFFC